MDHENCPNCGRQITGKVFGTVIVDHDTPFINRVLGTNVEAHCTKCVEDARQTAIAQNDVNRSAMAAKQQALEVKREPLLAEVRKLIPSIPLASIHSPPNWQFEVAGLVTAQSVAGTGLFAEVASVATDMFGRQSGAFRQKIETGEEICKNDLRLKAFELGANAIVGVDVDYGEVGGARCMLMVCMTGTAVRMVALDVFGDRTAAKLSRLKEVMSELDQLKI